MISDFDLNRSIEYQVVESLDPITGEDIYIAVPNGSEADEDYVMSKMFPKEDQSRILWELSTINNYQHQAFKDTNGRYNYSSEQVYGQLFTKIGRDGKSYCALGIPYGKLDCVQFLVLPSLSNLSDSRVIFGSFYNSPTEVTGEFKVMAHMRKEMSTKWLPRKANQLTLIHTPPNRLRETTPVKCTSTLVIEDWGTPEYKGIYLSGFTNIRNLDRLPYSDLCKIETPVTKLREKIDAEIQKMKTSTDNLGF